MNINVGERITYFRNERRYSVNYLANQAGVSQSYLRELELGHYQNPSVDVLYNLCDVLGISLSEFFNTNQSLYDTDNALLEEIKLLTPSQREQLRIFLKTLHA